MTAGGMRVKDYETIVVGALNANCYVLFSQAGGEAVVIDPGDEPEEIQAVVQGRGCSIGALLLTHSHFDHMLAARELQEATGAPVWLTAADQAILLGHWRTAKSLIGYIPGEPPRVDRELVAGQSVVVGDIELEVRSTPGHSPGGVSFVSHQLRAVFTGDALFAGTIGRTDLLGGDFETLITSLREQILTLPDDYAVLPGHGRASTVGTERQGNMFLAGAVVRPRWK